MIDHITYEIWIHEPGRNPGVVASLHGRAAADAKYKEWVDYCADLPAAATYGCDTHVSLIKATRTVERTNK